MPWMGMKYSPLTTHSIDSVVRHLSMSVQSLTTGNRGLIHWTNLFIDQKDRDCV